MGIFLVEPLKVEQKLVAYLLTIISDIEIFCIKRFWFISFSLFSLIHPIIIHIIYVRKNWFSFWFSYFPEIRVYWAKSI